MSLSTLQAELASAKTEYEAKELEIRNLFSEKNTQERRLQTLVAQVAAKRKELSNALSQSSAETLTSELQSLESQYQACQTLINNISNYLTVKAGLDKKNASELVERAPKNLLNFIYNSIKSELKVLTDEQVELMKDFVVIEKLIRSELSDSVRQSYFLGCVFDELYGQLKGSDFTSHKEKMLKKYDAESSIG
ncbi:hypothetical protein [Vibrio cholerae]|uniref:hypothetical protein n=1 Tax=Vibrio cholerae TaxID=666 RepID=UPI0004DAB333|nr:hypothetical protein [Vibrio cholerae]KEH04532.1 glyoxalase [Vibrio cholerae 2012EL-1759]NOE69788.1 glyoxalase [Vibrio cholerae]NOE87911.1 glyoxalase [Vibrio cholerae]NOE91577.1 glyoxalase [Vibrio cholerae]NOF11585.1 glyoxalase [Vibrio cholerae]